MGLYLVDRVAALRAGRLSVKLPEDFKATFRLIQEGGLTDPFRLVFAAATIVTRDLRAEVLNEVTEELQSELGELRSRQKTLAKDSANGFNMTLTDINNLIRSKTAKGKTPVRKPAKKAARNTFLVKLTISMGPPVCGSPLRRGTRNAIDGAFHQKPLADRENSPRVSGEVASHAKLPCQVVTGSPS